MDWLDRPITAGDPFVPLGRCRVVSKSNAWLFQPYSPRRGTWTRARVEWTTAEGLSVPHPVPWYEYSSISWEEDGLHYRLRIALGAAPGVPTGLVETIDGEWASNELAH